MLGLATLEVRSAARKVSQVSVGRVHDTGSSTVGVYQGFPRANRADILAETAIVLVRDDSPSLYLVAAAQHLATHLHGVSITASDEDVRREFFLLASAVRRAYRIPTAEELRIGHGGFSGAEAMILRAYCGHPFRSLWRVSPPEWCGMYELIRGVTCRPDFREACEGIAVLNADAFAHHDSPGNAAVRAVAEVCAERYLTLCGFPRCRTAFGEMEDAHRARALRMYEATSRHLADT